jgi:glycine/D-amino acid oxidase-like deaminating enzyme
MPAAARPEVPLPERTDVAIIGGGYTGLAAARVLARGGADVTVLERHAIGWGASSRNGGFVLPGYKPDIEDLARRLGVPEARRLFALSVEAVEGLEALIAEEGIACDYARCGTVVLAAKPGHMAGLERSRRFLQRELGHETTLLSAAELRGELASTRYHGGLLDPFAGAVQPARLVDGLAWAAERAGARLVEQADVQRAARDAGDWVLTTSAGEIRAGSILVATNAYTGGVVPALRRRVVPVGSYLIATAPLAPEVADRLIPRRRVLSDTKHLLYYFRRSADDRLVFGGRAAFTPTPIGRSAEILKRGLVEVFPELAGTPIDYAWGGQVAFTLDQMPHAGRLNDVYYALGYGGHGVAMATWLGARMGHAIAGRAPLPHLTAPFRPIPLYAGTPWFLPFAGGYYRIRDWLT